LELVALLVEPQCIAALHNHQIYPFALFDSRLVQFLFLKQKSRPMLIMASLGGFLLMMKKFLHKVQTQCIALYHQVGHMTGRSLSIY
jgi:hypothetical protein